ncbi:hypothetical protein Aperf_G00000130230 [Anoplocephala perfoliata]
MGVKLFQQCQVCTVTGANAFAAEVKPVLRLTPALTVSLPRFSEGWRRRRSVHCAATYEEEAAAHLFPSDLATIDNGIRNLFGYFLMVKPSHLKDYRSGLEKIEIPFLLRINESVIETEEAPRSGTTAVGSPMLPPQATSNDAVEISPTDRVYTGRSYRGYTVVEEPFSKTNLLPALERLPERGNVVLGKCTNASPIAVSGSVLSGSHSGAFRRTDIKTGLELRSRKVETSEGQFYVPQVKDGEVAWTVDVGEALDTQKSAKLVQNAD